MAPGFGTSGLRGLVGDLTPELIGRYVLAFLDCCPAGAVWVGRDLRPSSPALARTVLQTLGAAGVAAVDAGPAPTPALAMAAMAAGAGAVMVTGSHIPADRNGLKFYTPRGEITKAGEQAIAAAVARARPAAAAGRPGTSPTPGAVGPAYVRRSLAAFGPRALTGLRLGLYQHSCVGRDLMAEILRGLGADVVLLGRSETFIPVDTEALTPGLRGLAADWCRTLGLDALVSADGDGDRPLVVDARGEVVPGDVLGAITARRLGAQVLCTPVSSNTMVTAMQEFRRVRRTRIGSPFVIAAMEDELRADPGVRVAGYEANGGFLLGFAAEGALAPLPALMTRDAMLPIVAPLAEARARGMALHDLVASLPARFTAADRLADIAPDRSAPFLSELTDDAAARAGFFAPEGAEAGLDLTDGLRLRFADDAVVHLRPSGNAPEFRVYAEADSPGRARELVANVMTRIAGRLRS